MLMRRKIQSTSRYDLPSALLRMLQKVQLSLALVNLMSVEID